jgi:cytochrome c-type biogenesis protein
MDAWWFNPATAIWLGLLTAASPCPLATNLAAVSYLSREVRTPMRVLAQGTLYALGRTLAYVGLGVLLAASLLSLLDTAEFLQLRMTQFTGPVLVLIGLFLLASGYLTLVNTLGWI